MNFTALKYKANYYVLLLLAFVIPLERKLAPPLIILFLITSLFNNRFKRLSNHKIVGFTGLFILYLFGVIYSEESSIGITNLTEKLSLFIFPIAIYVLNIDLKKKLAAILYSFVGGVFVSGVLSLTVSLIDFYFTLDSSTFFYENSSYFLHPSYFAMYANFAILIVYFKAIFIRVKKSIKKYIVSLVLVFFFSILAVLSASKTGLIALLIIHSIAILYWMVSSKKYVRGGIVTMLFLALGFGTIGFSSIIQSRVGELFTVVFSDDTLNVTTTATRVEIWKVATNLIAEKPLIGYGTGNEKQVLVKAYNKLGFSFLAKKQLNAHNQFLQTTIAIGIFGGLVLVLMLFLPLYFSFKNSHYLYASFIVLIGFNFLTESMMERQAGIVFYSLFNALFFMFYFDKIHTIKT